LSPHQRDAAFKEHRNRIREIHDLINQQADNKSGQQ
jgi:hypothetical protein